MGLLRGEWGFQLLGFSVAVAEEIDGGRDLLGSGEKGVLAFCSDVSVSMLFSFRREKIKGNRKVCF
jgi:hypothetical protein